MQRVRMSLPYFENAGWAAEVVTVDAAYTDMAQDELLLQSIPASIKVHQVKAFNKKLTSKVGLGSIALRALWYYYRRVNQLLKADHYDLIYFSTTQFPVCVLGPYWKRRFKIPFVIDLQDPWHSEYYEDKPKHQRPPKYWFSYRLNKFTEAIAIKAAAGLISVSQTYLNDVKQRYPQLMNLPERVITFGTAGADFEIACLNKSRFNCLLDKSYRNITYIGRGGEDMHQALTMVFSAMQQGLKEQPVTFEQLRFTFIGTSYAPAGQGSPTIAPLAVAYGLDKYVAEHTDRISYYHTLSTLMESDALLIPASDAPGYTASKLYPYLSTCKPLLVVLDEQSPAAAVLKEYGAPYVYNFDEPKAAISGAYSFLRKTAETGIPQQHYHTGAVHKYSAENIAAQQCNFFNEIINAKP